MLSVCQFTPLILVSPSMMVATVSPKISRTSSNVMSVSSTVSCNSAATTLVRPSPISSAQMRATAMGW
jgi:hypothetical protein